MQWLLLENLDDLAGANGTSTLTDGEAEALFHRDRLDQRHRHLGGVARHDHLGALRQRDDAGDVRGAEVELRTVVRVERVVTATLILGQDVGGALEVGVRGNRTGLHDNLATLNVFALGAAEQQATVLAGPRLVKLLVEHLDTGDRGLLRRADADDLDLGVDGEGSALGATGDDGSTTGDREDVFDRHEERLVLVTHGVRDVVVSGLHEVENALNPLLVTLKGLEARDADDGSVVAVELLAGQQLANLELNELQDLFVVDHVGLVQRHHQVGDTNLAGEQHVLTGLSHRAVGSGNHEDRAVHLGSTGDHVLDVVSVARGVNVSVVTLRGLVLDVRDVDRDAALALFRCGVDRRKVALDVGRRGVLVSKHLRDGGRQRGLSVVDVTDGSDVYVRLRPLELGLSHSEIGRASCRERV